MAEVRHARLLASSFLTVVALGMVAALTAAPQAGCADPASGTTTTTTSSSGSGTGTGTSDICGQSCIDNALANLCTTQRNACTADSACSPILSCIQGCGTNAGCANACFATSPPTTFVDLQTCICVTNCPTCSATTFCP